jgi:GNAT superfamily N-acetyltransferase
MQCEWVTSSDAIDWRELSGLYRVTGPREKSADVLEVSFSNSRFVCFAYDGGTLIGAGRALADGVDCSYIADIVVHPDHQGQGVGSAILKRLVDMSAGHRVVILYAVPGREGFYRRHGFDRMLTAMARFVERDRARSFGLLEEA